MGQIKSGSHLWAALLLALAMLLPGRTFAQQPSPEQAAPLQAAGAPAQDGSEPDSQTTPVTVADALEEQGDIAGWAAVPQSVIPDAPDGFHERQEGNILWLYPDSAADEVDALAPTAADIWQRLEGDLGVDVDDDVQIRVARGPEEMRTLAPTLRPPPAYASGVAYTDLGLVILSLTAPESGESPDLPPLLIHELSHIALRRAVQGRPVPRWFVEGLAIYQSSERSIERLERLYQASLSDSLIPLSDLDHRFPNDSFEVNLAYAQSADIVKYLREGETRGESRFHDLIEGLAEGSGFEAALMDAYSLSPQGLEAEWHDSLDDKATALPVIVAGSSFWILAIAFVIWAWRRRRKRSDEKLAQWEAEERSRDEALARIEAQLDAQLLNLQAPTAPRTRRTSPIPTVTIDGETHTLH